MPSTMHRRWLKAAVTALALVVAGAALAVETTCTVKYLSAEHVYIDAGLRRGLVPAELQHL